MKKYNNNFVNTFIQLLKVYYVDMHLMNFETFPVLSCSLAAQDVKITQVPGSRICYFFSILAAKIYI